jgi:hypothetical protein
MPEIVKIRSESSLAPMILGNQSLWRADCRWSALIRESASGVQQLGETPYLFASRSEYAVTLMGVEEPQLNTLFWDKMINQVHTYFGTMAVPDTKYAVALQDMADQWGGLLGSTYHVILKNCYIRLSDVVLPLQGTLFDRAAASTPTVDQYAGPRAAQDTSAAAESPLSGARRNFKSEILRLLSEEPFETGYSHPIEEVFRTFIKAHGSLVSHWLDELIQATADRPSIHAALVRCLGRLDRDAIAPWGNAEIGKALLSSNLEVRESAIRAIEMWNAKDFAGELKTALSHETVSWMRDYIRDVLKDVES